MIHKVRLIGLNHDNLSNGSGQAHTTFQFANLLCDENGYSFGVIEDFDPATPPEGQYAARSYDYLNSSLRKNLTGNGNRDIVWFQRGEVNRSQEYKNTTVMDMLPKALKDVLKEVNKMIYAYNNNYEFVETHYDDKLFVPTFREMFKEGVSYYEGMFYEEGTTYDYYQKDDPTRTFNQISSDIYSVTPTIEDIFFGYISPYNYAGYYTGVSDTSTNVIFASPQIDNDAYTLIVEGGTELTEPTNAYAFGITPCFCI